MPASEARQVSSKANGSLSNGPGSPETKAVSCKNSFIHGLTGKGIVIAAEDLAEIARRTEAFTAQLKPMTPAGAFLIAQMATLLVREDRCFQYEAFAIAHNVRHAAEAFDEERFDLADSLLADLAKNPRTNLRKLKRMPEGVDLLIDAWSHLRTSLRIDPKPIWTVAHLQKAVIMTGMRSEIARGTRLGALSRAVWGDFAALGEADGAGLDEAFRQSWAKEALIDLIEAEIASLQAHRETLDFAMIELDRSEAGARALFDVSKKACLARRYEAEARRGYYKALAEFRRVEAEFAAQNVSAPTAPPPAELGSSRETAPPPVVEPVMAPLAAPKPPIPVVPSPVNRRARRAKLAKMSR